MKNIVINRDEAVTLRDGYRKAGKTVGFTSGVFDLVHAGHVEYLAAAKALVDILFVGVNSDSSVKSNKGDSRPIINEAQRAEVVAALKSVDHAFVFSELNNNENVTQLKPDVYIKAGDYSTDKLSSKGIVESFGGRVELVAFREGLSTTSIIEKIAATSPLEEGPAVPHKRAPAVFVDRDGTINEHVEYLSDPQKFAEIPNSFRALKRIQDLGYRIIVVTNQPGIGLGYFSKEDFFAVNREMMRQSSAVGCSIDKIYFCPHSKAENCPCRKPDPFFIRRAERELNIDISNSFVIGDMTSDVQLAKNAGCRSVLVRTGRGGNDGMFPVSADVTVDNLQAAADFLERRGPVSVEGAQSPKKTSRARSDELSDSVAATIGGDFNNIFGSILGCASLIAQRAGVDKGGVGIDDALTMLKKAADRGLAISKKMNNLLWSGSSSRGRRSLASCIKSVVELVSSSHNGECQIEVVCPEDVEVEMADFAIVQMLLELCENSLDAMSHLPERFIMFHVAVVQVREQAGSLELEPGTYAKVSIVDHGEGIDPDQREVVFQPFSSKKSVDDAGRVGISLSMAKAVMKKHGGSIALASQPQVGTNISLYFPVARP
jgi:rfaE bifunctional protein nucleotidyltransferase chain/domain